jgi:pyruvate dehydrogenase E1 component alpha subunit
MATRAESKKKGKPDLPEPDAARDWLRTMMLIRRFEERAGQMYAKAKVGGFLHLAIGEEATIVGAVEALRKDDYLISTYRSHGHALARGTSPDNVMAELFGKVDGTSGGRGGSMHIFDIGRRFMGGYGIVGGNLPLGAGLALASDYKGNDDVTLCVFGDGASNQGTFGETMNLAALWKLPIVFMVTNNQFGMGTALDRHSAVTDLKVKGESFGVPGVECDGMDVLDTYRVTCEAIKRVREERQPILIEAETYRFRGHSMADPEEYRTKEQVEEWRKKDPIEVFAKRLVDDGVMEEGDREKLDEEVVDQIDKAVQFADESDFPAPESLYEDIYVLGGQVKGWYSVDERGEGVHKGEDEEEMGKGARAEGHGQAAKSLDKKSTETDGDDAERDAEDSETEEGTDRGDLPKESADSDGADQSPGG